MAHIGSESERMYIVHWLTNGRGGSQGDMLAQREMCSVAHMVTRCLRYDVSKTHVMTNWELFLFIGIVLA